MICPSQCFLFISLIPRQDLHITFSPGYWLFLCNYALEETLKFLFLFLFLTQYLTLYYRPRLTLNYYIALSTASWVLGPGLSVMSHHTQVRIHRTLISVCSCVLASGMSLDIACVSVGWERILVPPLYLKIKLRTSGLHFYLAPIH